MTWTHKAAIGGSHRLRLGVGGPSRSGKTISSLRIATGMVSVLGGEIFLIDTDNEFALDYAYNPKTQEGFKFQHVDFPPPYSPERYLSVVEYCVAQNASVIIIDQMTNEHSGQGGVLERQQEVEKELAVKWKTSREKVCQSAWNEAKTIPHGKFVSYITRIKQPIIFNFRAKDKIKIVTNEKGKQEWVHIGYTPICTEQLDYEMTAMLILPPNSKGFPDKSLSEIRDPLLNIITLDRQIDELMGKRLAGWVKTETALDITPEPAKKPIIPATPEQLKKIMAIMASKSRTRVDEILGDLSGFCQREIGSSKELTNVEASDFINANKGE